MQPAHSMRPLNRQPLLHEHKGITLIELLVAITIVGLLLSLILPALSAARESARRTQCVNRLRNLGLAMLNHAETQRRFPAAGYFGGPNKLMPWQNHNWVVEILPHLGRRDIADRWDRRQSVFNPANQQLGRIHLPVLACPSDHTTVGVGDLSYALNGGIGESTNHGDVQDCIVDPFFHVLDLNGNGIVCVVPGTPEGEPSDRDVFKKLGLFFNENIGFKGSDGYQGTVRHHRTDSITDGASHTMMITENVRTGYDPYSPGVNWSTADSRRTKVYFSHRICRNHVCASGNVDFGLANAGDHAINSGRNSAEGAAPWASSNHEAGVNACFADGSVRFVEENIDGRVYYSLFTPQGGSLIGTALDEGVVGSAL